MGFAVTPLACWKTLAATIATPYPGRIITARNATKADKKMHAIVWLLEVCKEVMFDRALVRDLMILEDISWKGDESCVPSLWD